MNRIFIIVALVVAILAVVFHLGGIAGNLEFYLLAASLILTQVGMLTRP